MATPNPFGGSPGTVALDQTTFQRVVHAGNKATSKMLWARIRYNGAAWVVHSTTDNNEIVSGNLTWDTDHLNIALSGYTTAPLPMASPVIATAYSVAAEAIDAATIALTFRALDTGAQVTIESTDMDFNLLVIGI